MTETVISAEEDEPPPVAVRRKVYRTVVVVAGRLLAGTTRLTKPPDLRETFLTGTSASASPRVHEMFTHGRAFRKAPRCR